MPLQYHINEQVKILYNVYSKCWSKNLLEYLQKQWFNTYKNRTQDNRAPTSCHIYKVRLLTDIEILHLLWKSCPFWIKRKGKKRRRKRMSLYQLRRIGSDYRRFFWVILLVLVAVSARTCEAKCAFKGMFNFGDSNTDTGGFWAAFPSQSPPFGMTYFKKPVGRATDGRVVVDFLGEAPEYFFVISFFLFIHY